MAGYARTNTADIQSGQVVKSAPLNAELNAVVTAFAFSGGHNHDGSSTEGAYVGLIADVDALNKVVIDTSNNRVGFFSEVSSSAVEQVRIQDGAILPVTDNDIDLGASGTEFKDLYLDGTAHVDTLDVDENATVAGTLGVTGVTTLADILSIPDGSASAPSITNTGDTNSGLFFSAADTLAFTAGGTAQFTMADGAIAPVTDNDVDLGTSSLEFKDGYFDGTLHTDAINLNGTAITSTAAELNILDGVTSTAAELNILDGVTSTAAELNILDGVTATAAELNILDGVTSTAAELNILDGVTATAAEINVLDGITAVVGELNALDLGSTAVGTAIASKAVILDSNKDYTGLRNVTATGEVSMGTLDIGGTNVTSTAAELNILDGVTATAAEINTLDGVTAVVGELNALDLGSTAVGTAIASKAVILDSNKDYTGIRNFTITGNLTVGGTQTVVDTVTMNAQNAIVFEGATADDHETTLTITDPTADRTIKLPNQSGTLPVLAADSDTAITSTPAELNLLDGGTSAGTTAVAGGDGIVTNDGGTMRQTTVDTFDTYLSGTTKTLTNKTLTSPVISEISADSGLTIKSTNADANEGPILNLFRDSSSPADNDEIGQIDFSADDDAGSQTTYFRIQGQAVDVSQGSEDGAAYFQTISNGSMRQRMTFYTNEIAVNDGSQDFDFRVESDGNANMLFVEGGTNRVGIGTGSPAVELDVSGSITSSGTVTYGSLSDGSITITGFVDEDDMASNSATLIPTQQSVEARIQSVNGTANNVSGLTATGAELNVLDGASAGTIVNSKGVIYSSGGKVNATSLQIAGTDLTATAAEFNLLDGGSTVGTTAVASGDGLLTNDGGTMRQTNIDTFDTYLSGTAKTLTNKTLTAPKFADGGFIADANGNELIMLQTASSAVNQLEVTNAASGGSVVVGASGDDSNIDIDISPKGTGEVNIAAGNLNYGGTAITATGAELNLTDGSSSGTIVNSKAVIYGGSGEVNATTLQIAGSSITATAAELNIIDGDTSASATTLADADRFVTNDAGTMKQVALTDLKTYLSSAGFTTDDPTALAIALG